MVEALFAMKARSVDEEEHSAKALADINSQMLILKGRSSHWKTTRDAGETNTRNFLQPLEAKLGMTLPDMNEPFKVRDAKYAAMFDKYKSEVQIDLEAVGKGVALADKISSL